MPYTVTTHRSWFSRIGSSFGGVVIGLALLAAATYLLYWNEGRAVRTGGAISEAQLVCVEMKDPGKTDAGLEGKVVHAAGRADTQNFLTDDQFGVRTAGPAVAMSRTCEYYQWEETSKTETRNKIGGGQEEVTTYYYNKKWVGSPIDSGSFQDASYRGKNSVLLKADDRKWLAKDVTLGAYALPDFLKEEVGGAEPMTPVLSADQLKQLDARLREGRPQAAKAGGLVHVSGGAIYLGLYPDEPRIGDVRVNYKMVPPAQISLIAKVTGSTFEEFRSSKGAMFSRLAMGQQSAENMFGAAHDDNNTLAWMLRAVGFILAFVGLKMLFAPLSVIAGVIPLLGSLIGAGGAFVALLLALAWSLIVIAFSWLRFRPLLAGGLIAAALLFLAFLIFRGRKRGSCVR